MPLASLKPRPRPAIPAKDVIGVPEHLKLGRTKPPAAGAGAWKLLLVLAVLYTGLYVATDRAFSATPAPLPPTAPPGIFSEGRALQTTSHLADTIGFRQVSTNGEERAAQYLLAQAQSIASEAAALRPDLEVTAVREQATGALGRQKAFGFEIANAYNNLTNIVLRVAPRAVGSKAVSGGHETAQPKELLVNAHYDTTLGSPGASDAASCVGVALEIARTLVANASHTLTAPVVFLFNGGEETLMQASHGFMATSPHAKNLGAFINLESTGPWGPDVVFQHTGDWTLGAYARAAPYPRGTTVAQDFFELGVIPADTDYRMFSYRHHGSIPGIDVAFLFDGTAYHTARDETSRIRPGTLQGMGENMLATVLEFCRELAHHAHGRMDADGNVTVAERYYAPDQPGGLVFFDVLSTFMVVYDHKAAALLHSLPLAVLLTLSLVSLATQASGHKDTLWQRVPPPGALLGLAGQALLTFLSALVVPMALGAAKALATGAPMSWYGRPLAAYTTFLPAAAAGALLPQLSSGPVTPSSARSRSLGFALLFAAAATALTACNFRSSYGLAIWAAGAIAAAVLAPGPSSSTAWTWRSAFGVATCMATPILITLPTAMSIADHIMEKIGLAGSVPGPFGVAVPDTIVGTLTGTAIFLAGGAALPYIAAGLGKHARAVVAVLIALSLAAAAREVPLWRSSPGSTMQTFHPYSHRHPKRIIMQHIHRHTPQGQVVSSLYSFSSLDAVPVEVALPRAVLSLPHAEFDRHDWEALYPLNYLVTGAARVAPPPAPGTRTPSLKGTKGRTLWQRVLERFGARPGEENAPAAGLSRWYFELDTARPAWAVLNITGEVAAWSLGPEVATKQLANGNATAHMVRYASGPHTTVWPFWVDVPDGSSLHIELFVKHCEATPETEAVVASMPEWATTAAVTMWESGWEFGP